MSGKLHLVILTQGQFEEGSEEEFADNINVRVTVKVFFVFFFVFCFLFSVALRPNAGHGLLILEVS